MSPLMMKYRFERMISEPKKDIWLDLLKRIISFNFLTHLNINKHGQVDYSLHLYSTTTSTCSCWGCLNWSKEPTGSTTPSSSRIATTLLSDSMTTGVRSWWGTGRKKSQATFLKAGYATKVIPRIINGFVVLKWRIINWLLNLNYYLYHVCVSIYS